MLEYIVSLFVTVSTEYESDIQHFNQNWVKHQLSITREIISNNKPCTGRGYYYYYF